MWRQQAVVLFATFNGILSEAEGPVNAQDAPSGRCSDVTADFAEGSTPQFLSHLPSSPFLSAYRSHPPADGGMGVEE